MGGFPFTAHMAQTAAGNNWADYIGDNIKRILTYEGPIEAEELDYGQLRSASILVVRGTFASGEVLQTILRVKMQAHDFPELDPQNHRSVNPDGALWADLRCANPQEAFALLLKMWGVLQSYWPKWWTCTPEGGTELVVAPLSKDKGGTSWQAMVDQANLYLPLLQQI